MKIGNPVTKKLDKVLSERYGFESTELESIEYSVICKQERGFEFTAKVKIDSEGTWVEESFRGGTWWKNVDTGETTKVEVDYDDC